MISNVYSCSCKDHGDSCSLCRRKDANKKLADQLPYYKAPADSLISKFVEGIGFGTERLGTTRQREALVKKYHLMEQTLQFLFHNVQEHEAVIQEALEFDPLNSYF